MIDLRRLAEPWRRWDVTVRDLPLGLLIAVLSFVPALNDRGTRLGDLPARPFDALAVVAIALECLPLAVRRRRPAVCLALVSVGFAIDQLRGYHTVAGVALGIALISTAAHLHRHRRAVIAVATVAYVLLAVALDRRGAAEGLLGYVTFYLVTAIAWGTGAWLRRSRAAEAALRRHVAEASRTAERTRIARELHDVVTHHVTAMVVQAEAARYLTAAPDRLDHTLSAVTDTGRRAITDLRHLLDLLNPDHGTDPAGGSGPAADGSLRIGEIHALVEQTRQAGQPVEYTAEGSPPETAGSTEVAAYRVVQEALTNALKHAHGSRTTVHVRHGEKETTVEVSTDDSGSHAASPGGSGRGLAGLRERVAVLGGEFSADRRAGGGFVVRARIPSGTSS
ncbi:sensor histidine kinase [Jidongwangia harbinensis]|uniref:sensor histidine kinase n=1 Tax=Jidongwangia harbinensis TaxID=2878561 RepID=UPI001CDA0A32|nr:histidine kinase [Jidongwangia harbinensis]MCA2218753.1 histidine kinase [Jidongwangia harbinensis]